MCLAGTRYAYTPRALLSSRQYTMRLYAERLCREYYFFPYPLPRSKQTHLSSWLVLRLDLSLAPFISLFLAVAIYCVCLYHLISHQLTWSRLARISSVILCQIVGSSVIFCQFSHCLGGYDAALFGPALVWAHLGAFLISLRTLYAGLLAPALVGASKSLGLLSPPLVSIC